MTLVKRNGSLFPSLWNGFIDDDWIGNSNIAQAGTSVPAVNVIDTDDYYEVEMAAPGMKKEDFHVDLDNNLLSISAAEKFESADKDQNGNYTRREFRYSSFDRTFNLPDSIKTDKIAAKYVDGVLRVRLPKKEEAKPRPVKQISIS